MIEGSGARDIVIDEVQRIPELLHLVHDLLEKPGAPRFVLTGSSARKLRRGGVDLLAGRALVRTLHPFMAAELPDFDLAEALNTGLVPLVVDASRPADTLRAYAALYLTEEVQAEGLVRNVGGFARFLEALSFSQGSVLNLSNVARESAVSRKTVEGYLEIVEDLLLAFRVPVFTRRAKRATVAHPKFFFFDTGVFRSLRPHGPLDRPQRSKAPRSKVWLRSICAPGSHTATAIISWRTGARGRARKSISSFMAATRFWALKSGTRHVCAARICGL